MILTKRIVPFILAFAGFAVSLFASPTPTPTPKQGLTKSDKNKQNQKSITTEQLIRSANGWSYVNGQWVHPKGYNYVNGKILRTTARTGGALPNPPGKLALDNAQKLAPKTASIQTDAKAEAEKKAAERRKNLTPNAAPQTGSHL